MTASSLVRRLAAAFAVFVCAYAYFAMFRNYGFQLEDEGTLLFQLDRVARGQFPYSDFGTGYTPGFFAVGAATLQAVGYHVSGLRAVLAVLNAFAAAGLYLLAAPLVGSVLALASPMAFVLFLPVWPGDFAAFNVPYPAWPANAAWVIEALVMTAWMRRGGLTLVAAAGIVAGIAFAIKPNAGSFALAASCWIVAMGARERSLLDRAASVAASAAMLIGVWLAFGLVVFSMDAAIHLPLCITIAWVAAGRARAQLSTEKHPRALPAIALLVAGFAVPTLAWAVPVLARLGPHAFGRDVLLIGSGAADLYYLEHPVPETYAVAVTIATIAVAAIGRGIRRGTMAPVAPFLVIVAGTVATAIGTEWFSLAPEGFRRSVLWQLENAAFWLAPLANLGGVLLLVRRLGDARMASHTSAGADEHLRRLAVLVPLAIAMYLQLYPRTDFMHLLMGVPLTFVVALLLLRRVASWWSAGTWPEWTRGQHAVGTFVGVLLATVLSLRLGLNLESFALVAVNNDIAREGLATERATLWSESQAADDLVALGKTVSWLGQRVAPGEAVLTFPATTGVLFLTGTTSPVPHDYWYPGRPNHDEESAMVSSLAAAPPRYVVTLNSTWVFFGRAPTYFATARDFACRNYRLAARFGRFDVLERNDLAGTDPSPVETWEPTGATIDGVARPEISHRRQATRRWLASLTPDQVARARLPQKRAEAVLLLRGLRDAGDLRIAAWLVAGYHSNDQRLHDEAVAAMYTVVDTWAAARDRWACDYDAGALRPFVAGLSADATAMRSDQDRRVRAFAEVILSVTGETREPRGG